MVLTTRPNAGGVLFVSGGVMSRVVTSGGVCPGRDVRGAFCQFSEISTPGKLYQPSAKREIFIILECLNISVYLPPYHLTYFVVSTTNPSLTYIDK